MVKEQETRLIIGDDTFGITADSIREIISNRKNYIILARDAINNKDTPNTLIDCYKDTLPDLEKNMAILELREPSEIIKELKAVFETIKKCEKDGLSGTKIGTILFEENPELIELNPILITTAWGDDLMDNLIVARLIQNDENLTLGSNGELIILNET